MLSQEINQRSIQRGEEAKKNQALEAHEEVPKGSRKGPRDVHTFTRAVAFNGDIAPWDTSNAQMATSF